MSEKITYIAMAIAAIAILTAIYSMMDTPNTDNLATSSDLNAALNRISELENVELPATNFVTPSELSLGINGVATQIDSLVTIMHTQADLMETYQAEIITNRETIDNNHPVNFEPEEFEEDPVIGEQITPLIGIGHQITVELEKLEWFKGDLIAISGDARVAQGQVKLTIVEPDGKIRILNAIVTDEGRYHVFFGTDFKPSLLGEYTVLAQQRENISETISFILVE